MKSYLRILFAIIIATICWNASTAQQQDAGMWLSANIEKKINKNLKIAVAQEFRLQENYSQLGTYFTNVALQYKISKSFSASFNYRFLEKKQINLLYQTRNRFYLDVAYKYKADKWNFILRTRFQNQVKSISFDKDYSDPQYYWRNKISIKYSFKDFTPYTSVEIFNPLDNPKGNYINEIRYAIGSDYELSKKNTVGGYFLIDREQNVNDPLTAFIIGVEYTYAF